MRRYKIKHAFNLPSGKLLTPGMIYSTEDTDELARLQAVSKDGACEEIVSKPKEEKKDDTLPAPPKDPAEDLASVSGIGAKAMKKLAEAGIVTKSGLKTAILDPAKEGELKEILGTHFDKIQAHFQVQ